MNIECLIKVHEELCDRLNIRTYVYIHIYFSLESMYVHGLASQRSCHILAWLGMAWHGMAQLGINCYDSLQYHRG